MNFLIILATLFLVTNSQAASFWFEKKGEIAAMGLETVRTIIDLKERNLEWYCERSEIVLNNYIKEWSRFKCDDNENSNLCHVLENQIKKIDKATGSPYSSSLSKNIDFELKIAEKIEWTNEASKYAEANNISVLNMTIYKNLPNQSSTHGDWEYQVLENGPFSQAVELLAKDDLIEKNKYDSLKGSIKSPLFACAVLKNEIGISRDLGQKITLIENRKEEEITAFWDLYKNLKRFHMVNSPKEISKNPLYLVNLGQKLGSLMKEFEFKKIPEFKTDFIFNELFDVSLNEHGLLINIKSFWSYQFFKDGLFQPIKHEFFKKTKLISEEL